MKNIKLSKKQIWAAYKPFKANLEINEGTPRSGKTTAAHFRLANYYNRSRDTNHLIVAYNMEQAHRLYLDGDGTGLLHIFGSNAVKKHDDNGDHYELYTANGVKKIYYKGAGKSNSVGAITGMSLGSVTFGEINLLNIDMINECFRRTFAAQDRFHLADLNPPSPHHPVIKKVFDVQDIDWLHWTPNDNPALTEQRKEELRNQLSKSDYLYKRDWLGQRVMPDGVIYSMFDMQKHIMPAVFGIPLEMFFVADGGQSDATSCSCYMVVRDNGGMKLLRLANYYHSGHDTGEIKAMSQYAREIHEFINWCQQTYKMRHSEFFVDPACKSLREELIRIGLMNTGADNNRGEKLNGKEGLEVGIERLQNGIAEGRFYVIEANYPYDHRDFLTEIGMYARDKNGNPIDAYNHALDETRYANNYFFKRYIR